MTTTSLDAIVNNLLLQRRYSNHWYLEFLLYFKECLEELGFDGEVSTFRYAVLTLNDNHAIEIPDDYVDWVRVSTYVDGYIHPLVPDNALNLVPNYDSSFEIQPYSEGVASSTSTTETPTYSNWAFNPYWLMNNFNIFGENLGRMFGGIGASVFTFRENKIRNEIKINEYLDVTHILLEYAGNGMTADNATHIDVMAQSTMRAYAMWKFKENNRTYSKGEAQAEEQTYTNERQKLRARKSDLTIDVLRSIVQGNAAGVRF